MRQNGERASGSGAGAVGGAEARTKTLHAMATARLGAVCALAGLGLALLIRLWVAVPGVQGPGGLLGPFLGGWFGVRLAFWRMATIQGGVILAGASIAVWHRHAKRRSKAPRTLQAPRATFLRTLERIVATHDDLPYSLILFDIDGFRILNERHGTEACDDLLSCVKRKLAAALPEDARLARFGSDEFLAFVPRLAADEALALARGVLESVAGHPFDVGTGTLRATLSAGLASFPESAHSLRDAISQMTSALQEAQSGERGTVVAARHNKVGLCRLGAEVESALSERRVCPAYQPIIDLRTGHLIAEEGLARIVLPDGQILGADEFMNAATDLRLASRIDEALIEQALDRCREQSRQGDKRLRFINVSAALLQERRLLERTAFAFRGCDILGDLTGSRNPIVVEITERELLRDPAAALQALQPLLDIGARLAIDDFGSGYSSFLYLTALPVSFLKIEMQLLKTARTSARARSILKGIKAIAQDLDILTIAEGIEDEELARIARDHGMDWGQGFYFGRPVLGSLPRARASEKVS